VPRERVPLYSFLLRMLPPSWIDLFGAGTALAIKWLTTVAGRLGTSGQDHVLATLVCPG
jgi:hypothetical protein